MIDKAEFSAWVAACMQEEAEYEREMRFLERKKKEVRERRIAAQRVYEEDKRREEEMCRLRTSLPKDWQECPDEMLVAVVRDNGEPPVVLKKTEALNWIRQQRNWFSQVWSKKSVQVYPVYCIRDCEYILVPVLDGHIRHWELMRKRGLYVWIHG